MVGGAHVEHRADQRRAAGRRFGIDQRAAKHKRLDVDHRQLGFGVSRARAIRSAAAFADFALGRLRRRFDPIFGAPPGGAMITRLSRCGRK